MLMFSLALVQLFSVCCILPSYVRFYLFMSVWYVVGSLDGCLDLVNVSDSGLQMFFLDMEETGPTWFYVCYLCLQVTARYS